MSKEDEVRQQAILEKYISGLVTQQPISHRSQDIQNIAFPNLQGAT